MARQIRLAKIIAGTVFSLALVLLAAYLASVALNGGPEGAGMGAGAAAFGAVMVFLITVADG